MALMLLQHIVRMQPIQNEQNTCWDVRRSLLSRASP